MKKKPSFMERLFGAKPKPKRPMRRPPLRKAGGGKPTTFTNPAAGGCGKC